LSLPAAEDITEASSAITETTAIQQWYTRTAKEQPTGVAMPLARVLLWRITANLTPPQRITANPRPPLTPRRITANPRPPLTPPQRVVGSLTLEAVNLMVVVVENATRAFLLMV
jgi:hypothetical protein